MGLGSLEFRVEDLQIFGSRIFRGGLGSLGDQGLRKGGGGVRGPGPRALIRKHSLPANGPFRAGTGQLVLAPEQGEA